MKLTLTVASALLLAACGMKQTFSALPSGVDANAAHVRNAAGETVIYSFKAGNDGADPLGTVIADRSGALYGTTAFGGGGRCFGGCGTVFKLMPSGSTYVETVLYSFQGSNANDGSGPGAGVVADASGALYGTTEYGGDTAGDGTVFKLTPNGSNYTETVLHRFSAGKDGSAPLASLTLDADGNLYGTTLLGGNAPACGTNNSGRNLGCGTVFELARSGSAYKERVLYRFQSGTDGATPSSPPMIVGNRLIGTAATGGGNVSCGGAPINRGCGTVYALTRGKHAALTVLYAFTGEPSDGANPFAGLVMNKKGFLFGTSQYGGSANEGSAFSLTPSGSHYSEKLLHSFTGNSDGAYPLAPLAFSKRGALYGVTQYGGGGTNAGVAYELRKTHGAYAETILYTFATLAGGEYPVGGLLAGATGTLYGTTSYGGVASAAAGTVFALSP